MNHEPELMYTLSLNGMALFTGTKKECFMKVNEMPDLDYSNYSVKPSAPLDEPKKQIQQLFSNLSLLDDYNKGLFAIVDHLGCEYTIEQNAGTKDWVLVIARDETEIDEYHYNTLADAETDIEMLQAQGVEITKA